MHLTLCASASRSKLNQDALSKLQRYCAYQERCQSEVRSKLLKIEVYGEELESIIAELIASNFLNESRFAEAYARGKFRNNSWGKDKIRRELLRRKISTYDIQRALSAIDQDEYQERLHHLLSKKLTSIRHLDRWARQQRAYRFALSKGYENALIIQHLSDLNTDLPS